MGRLETGRFAERSISDVRTSLAEGEDPRVAMARLNREIVDFQKAGKDVPAHLLRLSKVLAGECIALSQGR